MCQKERIPVAPDPVRYPPDFIELRRNVRLVRAAAIVVASVVFSIIGLIFGFISASF